MSLSNDHPTLYEKFGGEEAVAKVVDCLYKFILADHTLSHFFEKMDMARLRLHQVKCISFALGGPYPYTGASVAGTSKGMDLKPEHVHAVAKHLQAAMFHLGIDAQDIRKVFARLTTLKEDMLYA